MSKPFPVPLESDYEAAGELVDLQFKERGGAWNKYFTDSTIGVENSEKVRELFENMWATARLVEPVLDDNFTPEDHMYRAADAFRAGMYTAELVATEVFEGIMNYDSIHDSLNGNLPFPVFDGKAEHDANGEFLRQLGFHGLNIIGDEAIRYLHEWGDEIVEEPSLRLTYALGSGAILALYHATYAKRYPQLVENYEVSRLLSFDEIEKYLSSNTDSSSN